MKTFENKKLILLALGIFTPLFLTNAKVNASSFGAEIFCTMRDGGNDHESSWDAAYTYIKKQKGGLFKVSPKNAAAQITETVIREREKIFIICVGNFYSFNTYYIKSKCRFIWSRNFLHYERWRK